MGWTDPDAVHHDVECLFVADGKAIKAAANITDHKGRCAFLRENPLHAGSLRDWQGSCTWGCTGKCRHLPILTPGAGLACAIEQKALEVLCGYVTSPVLRFAEVEGRTADPMDVLRKGIAKFRYVCGQPTTEQVKSVKGLKEELKKEYNEFQRHTEVSLFINPADLTGFIDDAPIGRIERSLVVRGVNVSDIMTAGLRPLLRRILLHEELVDRAVGQTGPCEFDDDGRWVKGSFLHDMLQVFVDILHLLLRGGEHLVQLVADQHVSDGSLTKEENTRRINQLAEKLKIVLAMSDDIMGPCEINSKVKGKVEFKVTMNGNQDKKLLTEEGSSAKISELLDCLFSLDSIEFLVYTVTTKDVWQSIFEGFGDLMKDLLSMTKVWSRVDVAYWQNRADLWGNLVAAHVDKSRITQYFRLITSGAIGQQLLIRNLAQVIR